MITEKEKLEYINAEKRNLLARVFSKIKNFSDSEDIVQTVSIKLLKSNVEFKDMDHVGKWLTCLLRCEIIDHHEFKKKKGSVLISVDKKYQEGADEQITLPVDVVDDNTESPLESLTRKESQSLQIDVIHAAIDKLNSRQKQAITLVYLEGKSLREAAEIMNTPYNTINVFIHYARKKLRQHIPFNSIVKQKTKINE
jgi:RNA polymerase sigma factor (sigma-70 family)